VRKPWKTPNTADSTAFEPTKFVSKFLHEAKPTDLLHKDNSLMTEIKELDGDLKTLVYENYSKFIAASDTIRKVGIFAKGG